MMLRFVPFAAVVLPLLSAQEPQTAEKTLPVFTDGQAQIVKGFADSKQWIREELWVETTFDSDGDGKPDRMHVDVTRQLQTDSEGLKVPVIYGTSPYFAGVGSTKSEFFWNPRQELGEAPPVRGEMPPIKFQPDRHVISQALVGTWVPRGFAVVHSESPGTGLSQGCPTVGGENEALAPKAVIDWLNGRAKGYTTPDGSDTIEAKWCTGKVGMTGTSYEGTLPIAAATTGVDGLECIIPVSPNTSYYHYYRSNGLVRHPGGYMGEDVDVLYDFINSGDPARRDWCNEHVRKEVLQKFQDRQTGDISAFWEGRDYVLHMKKWKAATLIAHGFNDWNVMPEHSVRVFVELKRMGIPCMAFFHQGGHGGEPPRALMNRWFTRFLYGIENGVEQDKRAWIVREGDSMAQPTPYDDYPVPGASPVTLYLGGDGNAVGSLSLKQDKSAKREKLVDDAEVTASTMALAEKSDNRLLYATPELKADLHLSGTAKVTIRMACNKPATNLSVRLVPLPYPQGNRARALDRIVTAGWADPQNHASLQKGEPLQPGKFVDVTFELQPDDQVIPAGKRIALMIFASDHEYTLWPKAGTEITIDLAGTKLELPVVDGAGAWAKATAN